MGFLPGNARQKAAVYEAPYSAIATELFGRGDAYDILKNKNNVEFLSTSFIRGTTFRNCIIIADEINNMTFHELDSLITRVGNNCRIIFCGDYRQTDLITTADRNGLQRFMNVLNTIKSFTHIEFGISDIVRSGIVKEYIISKSDLGYV
jgi:phosphate starvation-inducible protein PhoH